MKLTNLVRGKVGMVVAVGAIAALAGTGASVAAGNITSAQIKDGTIQTRDLTKNNFARFTATENVKTAMTPVSAVPAYAGARVVDVAATGQTPLVTLVLNKGTWKIDGVAPVLAHRRPGAGRPGPRRGDRARPAERVLGQLHRRRARRRHERRPGERSRGPSRSPPTTRRS